MTKLLLKVDEEDFKEYETQIEEALLSINVIFENSAFKKMMFGIDNLKVSPNFNLNPGSHVCKEFVNSQFHKSRF